MEKTKVTGIANWEYILCPQARMLEHHGNFAFSGYTSGVIFCQIFDLSFSFGLKYFWNTLVEIAGDWEER